MSSHRFEHLLETSPESHSSVAVMSSDRLSSHFASVSSSSPAFFACCPQAIWGSMLASQQQVTAELYRRAFERVQLCQRPEPSVRLYRYSAN